jgi:streptomycin 6-kinase
VAEVVEPSFRAFASLEPLGEVVQSRLRRTAERGASAAAVERALATLERLEGAATPPALVHGDFDGRNLLRCERRGLVTIDPLPAAGDPAYDAAYWAHANGLPGRRARQHAIAASWVSIPGASGAGAR